MSPKPGQMASYPEIRLRDSTVMSAKYRFAVLGDPVEHSLSPTIHTAALMSLGLEGTYVAIRAGESDFRAQVEALTASEWHGLNVTMPLKALAFALSDAHTGEAASSGSVNTLRFRGGRVEGHSTDVVAATAAFDDPRIERDRPVLVLGAGGAARAALSGAVGRERYLSSRDSKKAHALGQALEGDVALVPWGSSVAGAVIVNATPLGMHGESLPPEILPLAGALLDLAYGPAETPAVSFAREIGLSLIDGIEFLVLQAAASFEWWTGAPAPIEVMMEAARNI